MHSSLKIGTAYNWKDSWTDESSFVEKAKGVLKARTTAETCSQKEIFKVVFSKTFLALTENIFRKSKRFFKQNTDALAQGYQNFQFRPGSLPLKIKLFAAVISSPLSILTSLNDGYRRLVSY